MKSEKIEEIIALIHAKTLSGEVEWTHLDEYTFEINFPNSSVIIGYDDTIKIDELEPYLTFLNQNGIAVLRIDAKNIGSYSSYLTYKILEEIFEAANESVYKAEGTIDDVLQSLTTTTTSGTSTSTSTTTEAPSKAQPSKIPKRPIFIE